MSDEQQSVQMTDVDAFLQQFEHEILATEAAAIITTPTYSESLSRLQDGYLHCISVLQADNNILRQQVEEAHNGTRAVQLEGKDTDDMEMKDAQGEYDEEVGPKQGEVMGLEQRVDGWQETNKSENTTTHELHLQITNLQRELDIAWDKTNAHRSESNALNVCTRILEDKIERKNAALRKKDMHIKELQDHLAWWTQVAQKVGKAPMRDGSSKMRLEDVKMDDADEWTVEEGGSEEGEVRSINRQEKRMVAKATPKHKNRMIHQLQLQVKDLQRELQKEQQTSKLRGEVIQQLKEQADRDAEERRLDEIGDGVRKRKRIMPEAAPNFDQLEQLERQYEGREDIFAVTEGKKD